MPPTPTAIPSLLRARAGASEAQPHVADSARVQAANGQRRHADALPSDGKCVRVLQVIGSLYFGGAENVVVKLALGVDRARFETAVCCTIGLGPLSTPLVTNGIEVRVAGPRGRLHNWLRPWHVQRAIARFKPDTVHTHGLPALLEVGQVAMLGLVPRWVHTYHFGNYPYYEKRHYMTVERIFSRLPDQLVAVSDHQRDEVIRHHQLDPHRIITIPNGVQPNRFVADRAARGRKRAELGIPEHATVVGSVAVLSEQKGITYLLRAAQEIQRRTENVRFVIVGGGPLEDALRAEAAELGLSSVVQFTGWRSDVAELLCAFDVFVMSSLWEAMPVALLEAMAARLAIVVTDVGQNRKIVDDQVGGIVIPPRDSSAIANAVLQVIEQPSRASRLADAAFRRVEQQYTTARMLERYEALYAPSNVAARLSQGDRESNSRPW